MNRQIEQQIKIKIDKLINEEKKLENKAESLAFSYSGLRNIDNLLNLVCKKLQISLLLLDLLESIQENTERIKIRKLAEEKSKKAVLLIDELTFLRFSEDQKELLFKDPGFVQAKELLHKLLLKGGGVLFETKINDKKKAKKLAAAISNSIYKYIQKDDDYNHLFKTENLPGFIKTLVKMFLPVLAKENQKPPPYGIEEGEELFYTSKKMKMPLSQAIHYLESQVLADLKKKLIESPGSREIQKQIHITESKIRAYKQFKIFPRSSPVFPEKDYYTTGITGYTEDGEILVNISIPVIYKSSTNLERMQEMVKSEITRTLAGEGICPELDSEYFYLKGLESGLRGSSRTPSFKLNSYLCFKILKNHYPLLGQIENKDIFKKLIHFIRTSGKRNAQKLIENNILRGDNDLKALE